MNPINIVFFGSFQDYSVRILEALAKTFSVAAVVTTPPRPAGRHMQVTSTKVHQYAEKHGITVYPIEDLSSIPKDIQRPDFIVVAGYGKLIPDVWLTFPTVMPVNMHPSLLPEYRGAFPAEWAILRGEKETGVTLVSMTPEFDKGEILAQKRLPIDPTDTRETLYTKLYDEGAKLLIETLPHIKGGDVHPKPQPKGEYFYAKRLTREDGFVPWEEFRQKLEAKSEELDRKFRALSPWPGVWTTTPEGKRMKLVALSPNVLVQLEGGKPVLADEATPS
jgi:methionyl-tRNA formyltransferase